MAISRGKQYVRPVIVEVKPSKLAPSSPSPPSSPKAVRFAPSSSGTVSREITSTEHWSLYHFESHARTCPACFNPLAIYLRGGQLCTTGHDLAQDVAVHVYHKAGQIYSTEKDKHKDVHVELPPNYDQVRGLLKGMDHRLRATSRPIISYDQNYPISPRLSPSEQSYPEVRREVVIEPADSRRDRRSGRKSKHKSKRYETTVVHEHDSDREPSPRESKPEPSSRDSKPRERRGSLYYADRQRKEKNYYVEEREPDWERKKREDRR